MGKGPKTRLKLDPELWVTSFAFDPSDLCAAFCVDAASVSVDVAYQGFSAPFRQCDQHASGRCQDQLGVNQDTIANVPWAKLFEADFVKPKIVFLHRFTWQVSVRRKIFSVHVLYGDH